MRARAAAALSTALLLSLTLGGGPLAAQEIPQPDGNPLVAGLWTGKMKGTEFGLRAEAEGGRIRVPVTLVIGQEGNYLTATLSTVEDSPRQFLLDGFVGSGNLWLYGDASGFDTPILLSGHVKGKPGKYKMKVTGIAALTDTVAEVKISLKQAPVMLLQER